MTLVHVGLNEGEYECDVCHEFINYPWETLVKIGKQHYHEDCETKRRNGLT